MRTPPDAAGETAPAGVTQLGRAEHLRGILREHQIDVLITARTDLPAQQLQPIVEACEQCFVEWKVVPSSFQILIGGLRLQTVGRVPVLGVESFAIDRLFNRALKQLVDLVGSVVGLLLSAPVIAVCAILIKREPPKEPVFFAQTRVGAGGRLFTLWKLRSMCPEAAARDHLASARRKTMPVCSGSADFFGDGILMSCRSFGMSCGATRAWWGRGPSGRIM